MGKKNSGIKKRDSRDGKGKIQPREENPVSYIDEPPAFSLKYFQRSHCLSDCCKEEKSNFAEAIFKRKDLSWKTLYIISSHGLGCEKITQGLKVEKPECVGEAKILSFRFSGIKPMVGFRDRDVFYVLWFDRDFSVYKH